ncbi:unnamed protein product [Closterium sp. Naga37s-1]|nr:unnamed protein product [Closterium sp. Naga37s-1]
MATLWNRVQRMWRDRWLGLILGMWLQACGGISYAFSLYSAALKDKLQYSQEAVDGLGTAKDIGGNVGIVSGLLIDLMPAWAILAIGAAMHLFGYSMLYMASMGITRPPFWQMCAFIMLGTNGATWFNTAVLVTCIRNFEGDRGVVVGLLKGFIGLSGAIFTQVSEVEKGLGVTAMAVRVAKLLKGFIGLSGAIFTQVAMPVRLLKGFIGLSGAIFTQLYSALYAPHTAPFLLLCALLPPLVALLAMAVIRPMNPHLLAAARRDTGDNTRFRFLYVVGVGLALYLMLAMTLQETLSLSRPYRLVSMAGMVLLLALPISLPWVKAGSPMASKLPLHSPHEYHDHLSSATSFTFKPSATRTDHSLFPDGDDTPLLACTDTSSNSGRIGNTSSGGSSGGDSSGGGGGGGSGSGMGPISRKGSCESFSDTDGSPLRATSFTSTPASHSGAGRASERVGFDRFVTSTPASDRNAGGASERAVSPRGRGGEAALGQGGSSSTAGSGLGGGMGGNGGGVVGCGEGGKEGKSLEVEGRSSRGGPLEVGRGQRSSALRVGMDHTLLQAAVTPEYWLLFFAMGCGTGSGLTAINNLAQVAESLGSASVGALVALVSIWNFLGRMAAGYMSEQCLKRWSTPRPLCMLLVQAAMGCAHLLFSIGDPLLLYPAAALVGAAHGAHWTLMVTTASELFGLKHFGALYNTLSISSTIGSYCLSVKLAGYIYDRQSAIQRSALLHLQGLSSSASSLASPSLSPPTTTTIANWGAEAAAAGQARAVEAQLLLLEGSELPHRCMGPDCFRLTFLVMALVCVAGICALLSLVARTRRLYQEFHKVQRS